jgi:hypothetical protein
LKSFLFFGSILLSIAIIIGGHYYYQQKLNTIAVDATISAADTVTPTKNENEVQPSNSTDSTNELTELLKEWTESLNSDDSLSVTVFGSTSITNADDSLTSWPLLLESKISEFQGAPPIDITIVDVGKTVSIEVLTSDYLKQVIDSNPDVLLFEPFILNDNGSIRIEDSLEALDLMLQYITARLPDTTIVLMPPNPLYGANFYLTQIERLQQFALDHEYIYADHWQHWPSTEDTALNDYVENARPNEEGHALWAEAMLEVLTNE